MGIAIVALTGIMRVNTLFTLWGAGCTDLLGRTGLDEGTQSILVSAAVVMLVLASTLMLLSERDLASRWGIKLLETETLAPTACGPRLSPSAATPCPPRAT